MTEERAYAKINLALEVLGRRDDGYHEVSTVLHAVGLADHLTFEASEGLSLECDDRPSQARGTWCSGRRGCFSRPRGAALGPR